MAVRWIVEAAEALKGRSDDQDTAAETRVDPIMATLVSEEFRCDVTHR